MDLLYLVVGWAPPLIAMQVTSGFADNAIARGLLIAGGIVYTIGGFVLWIGNWLHRKRVAEGRPLRWTAKIFGYHEVFHLLTLIAAALHFSAIDLYLLPGRG